MACERCIDIHKAQNIGATSSSCECTCHDDKNSILHASDSITMLDMTEKNTSGSNRVRIEADGSFTPMD